ncbi:MAG: glycoside hydrolase family 3 N-terminal domain-containing protein, partial [Acholeplasmataceae bacterium]
DQEGGSIRRIYEGVSRVPGHMAIGAASFNRPTVSYEIGKILGEELKDLGINLNLAPVADVNNNPYNPVIGIRSFSDDPLLVSKLASDFARGLQNEGVLASYKHFLGHGDVTIDSHLDLPHVTLSLESLYNTELIPYRGNYISDAIMPAHILYDKIDNRFPASISKRIIKELLRDELGYKGLVISDCYEMDALQRAFALSEAAVFSVNASIDIIMVSHSFGKQLSVRKALIDGVKSGEIKKELIETSLKRILKAKEKYTKETDKEVDYKQNQKIAEECSLDSITINNGTLFDIDNNTIVIGVTNYLNSTAEDANVENMDVAKTLGSYYNIPYYSIDNKNFNVNSIAKMAKNKKIILALADSHLTLVQKVLYSNLIQNNNRIMLISLRTPYDIIGLDEPESHIVLYEYTKLSVQSLIKVLNGAPAKGKLPVKTKTNDSNKLNLPTNNLLIKKVVGYLNEHYAKYISLQLVADEFKISSAHLSRIFKREMGITFINYLNQIRVERAKVLLTTTTLYVYEIGNLCGFSDENYFTKLFKQKVGTTPISYRSQFGYYDQN